MKQKLLLCACLISLALSNILSCKKIEDLFSFTISNQSSITIQSSSPVNLPFNIASPSVATNSTEQFKNNNTDVKYVRNIILQNLQLTITSPSTQTFDFLKSIHIYISTSSSDEIELAYLDQIPVGVSSITLIPTTAALDQYVKAASYNLRTQVVTNQILTQDVTVGIQSQFKVTANL
jgi:hypothetical protein